MAMSIATKSKMEAVTKAAHGNWTCIYIKYKEEVNVIYK